MPEEPISQNNLPPAGQPGAVITPGSPSVEPPAPPQPRPQAQPDAQLEAQATSDGFKWRAPEFVAHDKSAGWYLLLTLAAAALAALIYLVTKDGVSAGVIIVAALFLGIYGARKPGLITHEVTPHLITISGKNYTYDQFKSFSIKQESPFKSITFIPLKRFSPMTTIYYPPQYEGNIIGILSAGLPYEEPRRDTVDSLMRRIRF
jgi:hypothetical protein